MVDTDMAVMVDTVLDTGMGGTVARDLLMLDQKLKLMLMPGTDVDTEDTVLAVMVDTDMAVMAVMVDTVLDTVMVDTVARDPLMPGTDEVMVMEVTDGASKYLTTPKKH